MDRKYGYRTTVLKVVDNMTNLKIRIKDKLIILDDDYVYALKNLVDFFNGFEEFGNIVLKMIKYKAIHKEEIVIDIKELEDFFAFLVRVITLMDDYEYEINEKLVNDRFGAILKELINKGYAESCDR